MSEAHHKTPLEQSSFLLLVAAVTLLLLVIVWPFFNPLLWAALAAVMFRPLHRWVLARVGGRMNPAAGITMLIIIFAVLLPAFFIGGLVIDEAASVVSAFQTGEIGVIAWFETVYGALPKSVQDAVENSGWTETGAIQERVRNLVGESAGIIAQQAVAVGSSALGFFLSFTIGLYVTYFLIRDGKRVGETILSSLPLERPIADRLAERFLSIVRATVKGSLVVGVVQGALGAITFWIAGIPSAILFGVVMAILSLIPAVGTALVWLPAALYLLAVGEIWQGVFVLFSGALVIGMADNVLRPILVGRDTGIPDWIILVTTLGGIAFAGFSGIVLGPLVAGLFLASWSILQEQRAEGEASVPAAPTY